MGSDVEVTFLCLILGLTWESVSPCYRWMAPFMDTLQSEPTAQLKNFPKVKADDKHNIQTHVAYLDLLVRKNKQEILLEMEKMHNFWFLFLSKNANIRLDALMTPIHVCCQT